MSELLVGQFEECKACSKKPGSPILCEPCRRNRKTISILNEEIYRQAKKLEVVKSVLNL